MEYFYQAVIVPNGLLERNPLPDGSEDIISVEKDGVKRITVIRAFYEAPPIKDADGNIYQYPIGYLRVRREPDGRATILVNQREIRFAYRENDEVKGDQEVWLMFEALRPYF